MDEIENNFGDVKGVKNEFQKKYELLSNPKFNATEILKLRKSNEFVMDARKLYEEKKGIMVGCQYGVDNYRSIKSLNEKVSEKIPKLPTTKFYGEIEEIEDGVERRFQHLNKFDILAYPPHDHHFLNKPFYIGPSLRKRILEEFEILKESLPSLIFVRVYASSRIDLIRALIVGREGTPYHQGLFLFDILIPSNYPSQPLQLFYHSYGLDLSPNFNKNGIVWFEGHPKVLSILQTLVAIQQLVLYGTKPYAEEKSSKLNKRVFMQTCEAMIHMLKCPPMHFEAFVLGYFRTRAHHILFNYKACEDGDKALKLLFFKLVKAFEANGTYCRHHYNQKEYDLALKEEELLDERYGNIWRTNSPKICRIKCGLAFTLIN